MKKKITIHDIARELNLTGSTVSRALNNHPAISVATIDLVKKTAERLNYSQNKVASSLRSGKTHIIGVIIPSAEISFFGSVVHGIDQVARANGYHVLLFQTNEIFKNEVEGIDTLLQLRVDGIMISMAKETLSYEHLLEVKKRNVPIVLFDRGNEDLGLPSVVIDDYEGAFQATKHLITEGFTKIAHIAGPQHLKIFKNRLEGYKAALKTYDLPINDDFICYGKVSVDSGKQCAEELFKLKDEPDAIFAVEDFTALGAIQAIKAQKKKIGVVGFANEEFGKYITPSLTTVNQQTIQMGEAAAKMFIDIIEKKVSQDDEHPKIITLMPELIIRESSIK